MKNSLLIENINWLFEELNKIFNNYEYNYTCKVWEEYEIKFDRLWLLAKNLSKDEIIKILNYILNKIDSNNKCSDYKDYYYIKWFELLKFISNNVNSSEVNNNVSKILENSKN